MRHGPLRPEKTSVWVLIAPAERERPAPNDRPEQLLPIIVLDGEPLSWPNGVLP